MKKKLSPTAILFLGFGIIILLGALLLMIPSASKDGVSVSFIDALFVSASAGCVTGLTPVNTSETWTLFGQIVILVLIQIGGIGFMTFLTMIMILFKQRIGLYNKTILMQSAGTFNIALVKPLIKQIAILTFVFETIGAILLTVFFWPQHGVESIWLGVFHSISAFCNSGFDLFGDSLVGYSNNIGVILTVSSLIICGALGFIVWYDMFKSKFKFGSILLLLCFFSLVRQI